MSEGKHPESVRVNGRKALIAALLAAALAASAFAAIGQAAHFGRLTTALDRAQKPWLMVCLAGVMLSYVGYILAYRDAARASGGPRFDLWTVTRIVAFGSGAFVVGASVGGLAVDYWALRRSGSGAHNAARRVLALATTEWTVLSMYACAAAVLVLIIGADAPPAMVVGWLTIVPACVIAARWCTAPRRVERFTQPPPATGRADRGRLATAWCNIAAHARAALADAIAGVVLVRHVLGHPARYPGGAIGYPIYWAGDILTLYAGLRCFGVHPPVIPMVLAYATSYVASALPLPAGGAGGIDAGIALALHAIGIALAPALLGTFAYRIFTFWLPIVPALALLPTVNQLQHTLPHVPHQGPDPDEDISFRVPSRRPVVDQSRRRHAAATRDDSVSP